MAISIGQLLFFKPPSKSVWHTAAVWIPDALRHCRDRNRHDRQWCNSPDKTSTEQYVGSQFFFPVPASLLVFLSLSLSALAAFRAGSSKQGVPVVQSTGFISPSGASDSPLSWEKYSDDKVQFQHGSVWRGGGSFLAKKALKNTFRRLAHALQFTHSFCFSSLHQFSSTSCTQTYRTAHVLANFQITGQSSNDSFV